MATRDDSYSSLAEVLPFVRYRLKGSDEFTSATIPKKEEVEKFIDRASGALNIALSSAGFSSPLNSTTATSTAVLLADDWVTGVVAEMVESTHPGSAINDGANQRMSGINLSSAARDFVMWNNLAFKRAGVTVNDPAHQGLTFTGLDKRSERSDPDNTSREQSKFHRGIFDNP